MNTVLVVEDEKAIQEMLTLFLKSKGYRVINAYDYDEAMHIIDREEQLDFILLDWMIPKGSGITILKNLKHDENKKHIPIIMLTAKTDLEDKLAGLDSGADDYIPKPISLKELNSRMLAILRRIKGTQTDYEFIRFKELLLDLTSHRLFIHDNEVAINRTEFKLLNVLAAQPDRVYSRSQLLDNVWGTDNYIDERTVDVAIGRLRKILEPSGYDSYLQTVRGEGYRFAKT